MSLKRAVCTIPRQDCPDCLLRTSCLYTKSFEPALALTEKASEFPEREQLPPVPPPPYVITPPLTDKTEYSAGDTLDFSLLLLGDATLYVPFFIHAFILMGKGGLGKRLADGRAQYRLESVRQADTVLYDPESGTLKQKPVINTMSVPDFSYVEGSPARLNFRLLTPLRFKEDNHLAAELPFSQLVRLALRRLRAVYSHYGSSVPSLPASDMLRLADTVQIEKNQLTWQDRGRYSNRQQRSMQMGGLVGDITYVGDVAPFMPLLESSRILHLGKQTAFGLGFFDYTVATL